MCVYMHLNCTWRGETWHKQHGCDTWSPDHVLWQTWHAAGGGNTFLPEAFGYCRCLRVSVRSPAVSPSITKCVHAMTHHPFKLGLPNLDHRCKIPWLRSLLVLGVIDLDLQGQIYLQSQYLPHFELFRAITQHPFKLGPPNLDQRC